MRQSTWRSLLLAAVAALLAACSTPAAGPSPSTDSGTAAWVATRSPGPTTAPSATSQPPPAATITPGTAWLSLGGAVWLGRGRIVDACFTPDGRLLAIGWGNGVSLWSAETGAERWWQPTNVCLIAVAVQPQGRAVAALLQDGSVALFDAATGDARRFEGAAPNVYWGAIAWSPGGERIAFQCIGPRRGDPIYLLDAQSGAVQEVPLSAISDSVHPHLAWSPDGTAITLASLAGSCSTVIDVETGRMRFSLGGSDACYSPYALAWSPDGRTIATVRAGGLDLLDARTGQVAHSMEGGVRGLPVSGSGRALSFSPDGRLLASRGGQGGHPVGWTPVVVWDVATGRVLGQLRGQSEREDRMAVGFDGDNVLSLYATGEITHWPIGAGEAEEATISRLPALAPERWLAWSADGSRLAAAGSGGLAVWDTATALPLASFGPGFSVPALSADGHLLAMTDIERHEEVIYDVAAGAVVCTLPDASSILQGAAFSPDGRLIAYGAGSRALVAEAATGRVLSELAGYPEEQSIARVVWSPDSSALVVASGWPNSGPPGLVILWEQGKDGAFREAFRTQAVHTSYPGMPVALFCPSGVLVAFEDMPRGEASAAHIPVFDRTTGEAIITLKEYVLGTWASDEVLLAAEAQYDTWLTRWNVRSGEKAVGRGRGINAAAYSPGGAYYVTTGDDRRLGRGGIDVHDWATGQVLCRIAHGADVFHVSWSPDGRGIASLAANGTTAVWTVGDGPGEGR